MTEDTSGYVMAYIFDTTFLPVHQNNGFDDV